MLPSPILWLDSAQLKLLDQTKLPSQKIYLLCDSKEQVFQAIRNLSVRGAPAISIAGAYGLCLEAFHAKETDLSVLKNQIHAAALYLKNARPTAVNLSWALEQMLHRSAAFSGSVSEYREILLKEARAIHHQDQKMCDAIGMVGEPFVTDGMRVLTHCNTGIFATGGIGTALGVLYKAWEKGKRFLVYVNETRPLLQGARLSTLELLEAGIPVTLICDSVAGFLMKQKKVDIVIVGADRIAKNGDTANKIGTYTLAKLAKQFDIPFYVAAPSTTFDCTLASGEYIPIEERSAQEVTQGFGFATAPENVSVYNPAFDVTEAALISAFFTEKGVLRASELSSNFLL
jgi:methylthioribose-1-phosphate isomerase